jgi:hypothetical protein
MTQYEFRCEDTGEVVMLDFEQMMEQDSMGCITLPDGSVVRRVRTGERFKKREAVKLAHDAHIVSDALGFGEHELDKYAADRDAKKINVEFREDPGSPGFYQVHADDKKEFAKYMKLRGFVDRNSRNGGGAIMCPETLKRAKEIVLREHKDKISLTK